MLGVVIWSCRSTGRAIIWCSDHRDLAHFDGLGAGMTPITVEVGDLVEATLIPSKFVRRCTALRVLEAAYMPSVAQDLMEQGAQTVAA